MNNWIITTVPTEGYKEIETLSDNKFVVHLSPKEEGYLTTCYECVADTDDIDELTADLEAWKARRESLTSYRSNQERMKAIQAELAATDYLALKAFEGEDMSEHEGWKERRAALREEYRQLEQANLSL